MKYIVFYDERLQFDGRRPSDSELNEISKFAGILNYDEICKALPLSCEVLINLHGRYVPASIWTEFMNRLSEGMGYVGLGAGTPLSVPAIRTDNGIEIQQEQTTYHESLGICHGLSISAQRYNKIVANEDCPVLAGNEDCYEVGDTVGLIVRFTKTKDIPEDGGSSSGSMDAVIYPLLTGFGKEERPFAAPVVVIDNTKGTFAGGRWIFSNLAVTQQFWSSGGVEVIKKLAMFASYGVTEVRVRPNYASYFPGEQPAILVSAEKIGGEPTTAKLHLQITKCGEQVYIKEIEINLMRECIYQTIPTSLAVEPGLYEICTKIEIDQQYLCTQHNGFWGYDRALLESGSDLTCDRDYFFKDGKPMPIVGMTYMQSDVHRKYAYLPNPYIWDKDMAEMKRAGINMIRTGMWTGIRTVAFNDGIVNEEFLRFIDAMFLTAKKHDIPIVFNFFAFTPTVWDGINPYLDPRSIKAQKRFISSVVGRHSCSKGVLWDYINEPSICALHTQWCPKPNRDIFEIQAWQVWLKKRHVNIERLRERWNSTPVELPSFESATLPADEDMIGDTRYIGLHKPMKNHDYILFTQDIMNAWADAMSLTTKSNNAKQLTTIGQDEALVSHRPSPYFMNSSIDYTTCHSWWLNDSIYWDGLFSKTHNKPSLIQETGIMYVQNANGRPRRDEEELRNILERKYALAFAADNAGAIQWIWNINHYMDDINEVNIGAVRPDGSQKLEADVSYDFGKFMQHIAFMFQNRKLEEAAVIFPFSSSFSARDSAAAATKCAARILGYELNIPFRTFGEYQLSDLQGAKLIIMPSITCISEHAFNRLLDLADSGSVVLISGVISRDEYFINIPNRLEKLGFKTKVVNTQREEQLIIDNYSYRVPFGGNSYEWVDKEQVEIKDLQNKQCACVPDTLHIVPVGKGFIIWSPLPVELSENSEVVKDVYKKAINIAKIQSTFEWISEKNDGILLKKLSFDKGSLMIAVSESGCDSTVEVRDNESGVIYSFFLESGRSVLFAVDDAGHIISSYRDVLITEKKI